MDVAIFWDAAPCSPYVKRSFGGMYQLIFRVENKQSNNLYGLHGAISPKKETFITTAVRA
jgi:hypothetical protein